ncbi:MAG: polysaccharide deacetylase family protein [Prosthecobacter sp.]|nr:polysaccharide deacetylase family protein [Prosthecobacter sp.]
MKSPPIRNSIIFLLALIAAATQAADLGGAKVGLNDYHGPAVTQVQRLEPFKLRVDLQANGETKPLILGVELPSSGPNAWPFADVEVRDATGKTLLVRRTGIEWFNMLIPLPAGLTTCFIQAIPPPGGWPKPTSDKDRAIQDSATGLRMRIAKWHDGRTAALSIRFDDSHPTQLTKAVPILREYGFRGTFMINPGAVEPGSRRTSDFQEHLPEWEALSKQGDHELANHSAHHRGALGDADMEAEIGEAARAIWKLTPNRSKLMALNLGGGTLWETTHTLRHYLDTYQQFDASENSTGMDDSYGNRVENFRRILQQHIQRGLWCRIHYHYIGDGLSSSEANFRAAMEIAKQNAASLWIAGMADIYKYQTERNAAKLTLLTSDARHLTFQLTCPVDAALYDQPLTIEAAPPAAWASQKLLIKDSQGAALPTTPAQVENASALLFHVPPQDGTYSISVAP